MSPRTTEAAGPVHDIHAAPSPAAVFEPHRAPSSTAAAATDNRFDGAAAVANRIPVAGSKQRRKGKPLSSGWKSLAWTKTPAPPVAVRRSSSPTSDKAPFGATPVPQYPTRLQQQQQQQHLPRIVDPAAGGTESDKMRTAVRRSTSQGGDDKQQQQGSSRRRQPHASAKRSGREGSLVGIAEGTGRRSPQRSSLSPARATIDDELRVQQQPPQQQQQQQQQQQHENHSISYLAGSKFSSAGGVSDRGTGGGQAKTLANFMLSSSSADSSRPLRRAVRYLDAPADDIASAMPSQHRRQSSTDKDGNVLLERSLSDTSIVTASDFGLSQPNKPIILTHMKDDDAIEELVELLARGKGLSVVKHATGLGGSKSRKMLRFNNVEGSLSVCGMLPPYFKTKIPVRDIDRVDAKWCCVVVHAKGRSPLRLEVDSFATADILRVGLMAASRVMITPPAEETPPPPPVVKKTQPDPEQGLSSVRPGHRASQVYDPDAALSVAALLAKEMEEERLVASKSTGEVSGSARSAGRPSPREEQRTTPVLKRSLSMTSVASTNIVDHCAEVSIINNRRSMPRNGYGGGGTGTPMGNVPAEGSVMDTKAALRRLYTAIDGRGMVAVKRNPNGKGRSRVMVRSRGKEGAVGWAHVLPPFSKKFIAVKELMGASRSSRVVTVTFKGREPVLFETDRLTDALILEQGFISIALQQKNERTLS